MTVKIKIKGASDSPTLVNERTPMQEELGRIFRGCNVVARACAALMAFSGVRPESLGDYTGMNGLVIGDFLEVELDNVAKRVTFKKTPSLVRVRKVISKKGHQMAKAIGEGAREVKGIELVMKKVGELDPEDFVSADAVAFGRQTPSVASPELEGVLRQGMEGA